MEDGRMYNNLKANAEQKEIINTTESPLLVIAGPGAGKTKTLVDRVIHLIVDKKVSAENIMVATFTEKAAKELITRISNQAQQSGQTINISDMYVGTLHSIFLRILEEYRQHTPLKRNYRVLDDFEQKYFAYQNTYRFTHLEKITNLMDRPSHSWYCVGKICELVNKVSENNLDLEKLAQCTESPVLPALAELTEKYRSILNEQNALDFSMIQIYMWNLLQESDVLSELRDKIQYIMVDEYQDTNRIQEQILLKLAAPKNKICVVGDDDQALYRFRGATVENILRFQEKFKPNECKKIELYKNYRSHPEIIDFYNKWMANPYEERTKRGILKATGSWDGPNGERYRHNKVILNAGKQNKENSPYIGVVTAMGETEESWCQNVFDFIRKLQSSGVLTDYNQCTLLTKSVKNHRIVALANFLEKKNIPVFSPRSALFFERAEIKLAIGTFVFLFPHLVETYLAQSYSLDVWPYYKSCEDFFGNVLRTNPKEYENLRIWAAKKARELNGLKVNTDYTFADLFYEMLQFKPFSDYVSVDLASGVQDLRPIYNLALLSKLLSKFEYLNRVTVIPAKLEKKTALLKSLFNEFFNFLYSGGIEEYEDYDMVTPSGCISFMTIHQSKGLEFPITMVDSLESSPHKDFDNIDEDIATYYYGQDSWEPLDRIKYFDFWRLYYTAYSRAQNLLVLTGIDNHQTRGSREHWMPSKYFMTIYQDILPWQKLFKGKRTELKLDTVKPVNIKHEYSFTSHILVYENCPMQYKFFKELEFTPVRTGAIMFGSLVHQTIEDIHKHVLEGDSQAVTQENIETWLNDNYQQLAKHEGIYLQAHTLKSIQKHIENYVGYAQADWERIKEAEVPVTLQKEGYILKGTIDLIKGKGNTVEILDFKTDQKPDINSDKGKEQLRKYRRQLEIYAHIIQERYGLKVSRMHLFYTGSENESPLISYDYIPKAIEKTIRQVSDVVEHIEKKDFAIKTPCDPKRCTECDLKFLCRK